MCSVWIPFVCARLGRLTGKRVSSACSGGEGIWGGEMKVSIDPLALDSQPLGFIGHDPLDGECVAADAALCQHDREVELFAQQDQPCPPGVEMLRHPTTKTTKAVVFRRDGAGLEVDNRINEQPVQNFLRIKKLLAGLETTDFLLLISNLFLQSLDPGFELL